MKKTMRATFTAFCFLALAPFSPVAALDVSSALDAYRAALPDGSDVTYEKITIDPSIGGFVIEGFKQTGPDNKEVTIGRTEVSGIEVDGSGSMQGLRLAKLQDIKVPGEELSIGRIDLKGLAADGLQRIFLPGQGQAFFESVSFEMLALRDIEWLNDDEPLKIRKVHVKPVEDNDLKITMRDVEIGDPYEGETLRTRTIITDITLPSTEQLFDPQSSITDEFSRMPFTAHAFGPEFLTFDLALQMDFLETRYESLDSNRGRFEFEGENLNFYFRETERNLQMDLRLTGHSEHDEVTNASVGQFEFSSSVLGDASVDFDLEDMEHLDEFLDNFENLKSYTVSPTVNSLELDFQDKGGFDHVFNGIFGEGEAQRTAIADRLTALVADSTKFELSAETQTQLEQLRQFLMAPKHINIALNPPKPVKLTTIVSSVKAYPAGMVKLLGLTIEAND